MNDLVLETKIPGYPRQQGKVRDIYDLDKQLLLVACDRISAFDVVLPTGIPQKGHLLTRISEFWFNRFGDRVANHMIRVMDGEIPEDLLPYAGVLRGRSMLCRKCEVIPIECVVRGYLAGSGWRDYLSSGSVCGIPLPTGLEQCAQLPEPLFTPATKATRGHDENISFEQACDLVGEAVVEKLRARSIEIYREASDYACARGVIIADTKFEWGWFEGELMLIDELLTPDSSRFWPAEDYTPGRDQDSFDKQYVRNYLQQLADRGEWQKSPPGPELPAEIVRNTARKYSEAYELLTGGAFVSA